MRVTQRVKKILSLYESDNPGTKTNLARMLMEGKLAGSGRVVMLPLQPLAEAGNPNWCNIDYHIQMAVDGGFSAVIASRMLLEQVADNFAGCIPLMLEMTENADPAETVKSALRLGCIGIASVFSDVGNADRSGAIIAEARANGLASMVCLTAMHASQDVVSCLSRAAEAGAHIVSVRMPDETVRPGAQTPADTATISDRVRHIRQSCAGGRRIVMFSATASEEDQILNDIRAVRDGGGGGYILPASAVHRSYESVVQLADMAIKVYQGKA